MYERQRWMQRPWCWYRSSQFRLCIECFLVSISQKEPAPMTVNRRWFAGLLIVWLNPCLNYSHVPYQEQWYLLTSVWPLYAQHIGMVTQSKFLTTAPWVSLRLYVKTNLEKGPSLLRETPAISPHQQSFLPRWSCLSNLLVFKEAVTRRMDEVISSCHFPWFCQGLWLRQSQIYFCENEVLRSWWYRRAVVYCTHIISRQNRLKKR